VELDKSISEVLATYRLDARKFSIQRINSGHINYTFKVEPGYILQRINKLVFLQPEAISNNLRVAADFLQKQVPEYLFLGAVKNVRGEDLVQDDEGYSWRLFPYIPNTITINEVENANQAKAAARAFARLSRHLSGCDISLFKETIPQFHDLSFRFAQFKQALSATQANRKEMATEVCHSYLRLDHLVKEYEQLIRSGKLKPRVMHNDTKINNVLFDKTTSEAVCVIDLDTLMPGYFIFDLGDMMRTFVSPVSEEESDFTKIKVRPDIKAAIIEGYLSEMGDELSADEINSIPFAGPMMTYMIGLRFLTDYLNGDVYFQTSYPHQNLNRAKNQLQLLEKLVD